MLVLRAKEGKKHNSEGTWEVSASVLTLIM